MCGIVGYVGHDDCVGALLTALERMEYRGYDSAGVALVQDGRIQMRKSEGMLKKLQALLQEDPIHGTVGIGHTRWATHGAPYAINAHPHIDMNGKIALVHNGIIENYAALKADLIEKGCVFVSETDTEVVAQLLGYYYNGDMLSTLMQTLPMLEGAFSLAILCKSEPDKIYCTRKDAPMIVAQSPRGQLAASDIAALLDYSRDVYLLDDGEIAVLGKDVLTIYNEQGETVQKQAMHVEWDVSAAQKGGYEHFMLKEINEVPEALKDTFRQYVDQKQEVIRRQALPIDEEEIKGIRKITVLACGTAYHAGLVGKYLLEQLARIPVNVEIASEFRYSNPIIQEGELFIVVSQSGETADTIAAMREAKNRGGIIWAVCNVVGSTIDREADFVFATRAGLEVAVASTKAYSSQLMAFYVIALDIARKKGLLSLAREKELVRELLIIPQKAREMVKMAPRIEQFCNTSPLLPKYDDVNDPSYYMQIFFIGRGMDCAISQEASLKLKEISYIHSEAYAAGELKHGTIALIEKGTLVVAIATQQTLLPKIISNIMAVRARGANVLAVCMQGAQALEGQADEIWEIPQTDDLFTPLLSIIPMQLFSYYMAKRKGCSIDKPRNLAKSVTVE
ncbi:glutamine--fructose-6-phosphate transaminase (isomerizing) [Clostridia bacterium OttesenSCG-928-F22]|nr:glutamine--fructose-6-phosphate transaminase (isomerizing) [Clostridia bacterium OttesenSCG-928-F22]